MTAEPQRWSTDRAAAWAERTGWLVGCNFAPSTAGNQLELWQAATFDRETIDRELGWAAGLGMNVIRLYLHDLVFDAEGSAFLDRVDDVLAIAESHGISVMPVLFDGVWHPEPKLGAQPDPTPRLHNSIWVQSPGRPVLDDRSRWSALQPYVVETIRRFADDPRVICWDLFNEPDQLDRDTIISGSRDGKAEAAADLLVEVFGWAREIDPTQPLTAGVWEYDEAHRPVQAPFNDVALAHSDIITFHCYEPAPALRSVIAELADHGRPLVCTEWLARTAGSNVDLLDEFRSSGVGAINWGLVDGRTQTRFPWRSWTEPVPDDEPWFHELLHPDGRPYDEDEADHFRRVTRGGD